VSNNKVVYDSKFEDPDLRNAWDLRINGHKLWVTANASGKLIQYTLDGTKIISYDFPSGEAPTGLALNNPIDPLPYILYIVTEQGRLYGLNPSLSSPIVLLADNSSMGAVYKGLTKFGNLLYAADFHNKKIAVFDELQNFALVNLSFIDLDKNDPLPSNYSPFNIVNVGTEHLYVLYAEKEPDEDEEVVGEGKGFVDIYTLSGTFIRRFASRGALNAPWGLTLKKKKHDKFSVLIGNFGNGKINEYSVEGKLIGALEDSKDRDLQIDGLWALVSRDDSIYFAAGPNDENDGVVGKLSQKD